MAQLVRRIRAQEAAPPWGLLAALVTLLVAFAFMTVVGSVIGVVLLGAAHPAVQVFSWSVGGVLLVLFVWLMQREPDRRAALRMGVSSLPLLTAFGIGLGAAVTLDLLAIPFAGAVLRPPELASFVQPPGWVAWLFAGVFMLAVQPIAEELVFRGVLYPAMRAAQGVWVAIIVTTIFYGIFHVLVYPPPMGGAAGLWYGLVEPLLAGLVLTVIRAATRSTRAVIAAHVGVGVFALLKTSLIVGAF